ncbi:hypothetical protein [Pelodictyon phaeoclathratiforme]|uniref:hypothetical protein n=1 Tax=Pelodictyon phaeoclathratiforme TaxID=34090 RepID=UPI001232E898|nr:hypothetical protein [Pelodictyon phaeoclathratiforme]MBV5289258.1 hypothetical protein [Pelodictyon phaeoclathratiforme]
MALRDIVSKSIQTLIRLKKGLSTIHPIRLDEFRISICLRIHLPDIVEDGICFCCFFSTLVF